MCGDLSALVKSDKKNVPKQAHTFMHSHGKPLTNKSQKITCYKLFWLSRRNEKQQFFIIYNERSQKIPFQLTSTQVTI